MKLFKKYLLLKFMALLSLFIFSCNNNKQTRTYNTSTPINLQSNQEELRQQQERLRIQNQRVALAKEYASRFTKKTMKSVSPNTGRNAKTTVENVDFNTNTHKVTLKIKSEWYANPTNWNPLADHELHSMTGNLTLYADNQTEYKLLKQNGVMDEAKLNDDVLAVLYLLSKED